MFANEPKFISIGEPLRGSATLPRAKTYPDQKLFWCGRYFHNPEIERKYGFNIHLMTKNTDMSLPISIMEIIVDNRYRDQATIQHSMEKRDEPIIVRMGVGDWQDAQQECPDIGKKVKKVSKRFVLF